MCRVWWVGKFSLRSLYTVTLGWLCWCEPGKAQPLWALTFKIFACGSRDILHQAGDFKVAKYEGVLDFYWSQVTSYHHQRMVSNRSDVAVVQYDDGRSNAAGRAERICVASTCLIVLGTTWMEGTRGRG